MRYSTESEARDREGQSFGNQRRLSVAIPEKVNEILRTHLLGKRGEEDLAFALYSPSAGADRSSALIHTPLLPTDGDRQQHGNASFNLQFFERALDLATSSQSGIAFLHSHLGPGWQGMSHDDMVAEYRLAGTCLTMTDLPLVGLTLGTDGIWSARFWSHQADRVYARRWCESVRVVGRRLRVSFDEHQLAIPLYQEMFRRTQTVWGKNGHAHLARLQVGIVGLGSVGMAVAETLARSGFQRLTLIDFDDVQPHNLDRLQGATREDIGRRKVNVARDLVERSSTAERVSITEKCSSVVEHAGYKGALDCDVLFSCVDRPRARQILNHMAYNHLIPVIDGGIAVRFKNRTFAGAEWQVQTVGPGRPCLECLNAFSAGDADTERLGMLDDPTYMQGLADDHALKRNENVYPFSTNLASLEFFHLIALAAGLRQIESSGVQRFHFVAGMFESDDSISCKPSCDINKLIARGDVFFSLAGSDQTAEIARRRTAGHGLTVGEPELDQS